MARTRKAPEPDAPGLEPLRAGLCLFCLLGCIFLWASVWDFDLGDWPSTKISPHNVITQNACGRIGAWVAYQLFFYVGPGTYAFLACLSGFVILWMLRGRVRLLWQRALGTALLVSVTAVSAHMLGASGPAPLPIESGGILGLGLGRFLQDNFHWAGTTLILVYCLVMGFLFAADELASRVPRWLRRAGGVSSVALAGVGGSVVRRVSSAMSAPARDTLAEQAEPKINSGRVKPPLEATRDEATAKQAESPPTELFEEPADEQIENAVPVVVTDRAHQEADEDQRASADEGASASESAVDEDADSPLAQETPVMRRAYPAELPDWDFPPVSLLDEPEYQYSLEQESRVRSQARLLEQTLEEYRVDAAVVEIDTGPVITMFELQVGVGVKVSQIASLSNDIARALRAPAVRVVAPIPGKNTIGIEVPNIDKEKVRLRELLQLGGKKQGRMTVPLFLGKDASGNALIGDLAQMPHMLIAGTTGSGKSVCINSIIASIMLTQRPDQTKLILVDPKMVELAGFRDIPHLMCPIITEVSRAEAILDWAVTKMEERYEILAEAGVRNVAAFNRLTKEDIYDRFNPADEMEKAGIPTHIPHVIIVIDELADLMMTSAKEVEHCLARLAQKSRAVGIHIIVATQRPEARIVTGLIKSNMPCRIAFRVASRMDSRIVLDQNGAEVLMGQGDMMFLPPGQSKLVRAQGTFVEDHELHKVIEFVRRRGQADYHPELVKLNRAESASSMERDALFDEAVKIILETKRGSVSLLQRRLQVGYSRASRLVDQMADAGIVGDYKGSQAREVLVSVEEWDAIRASRDREETEEAERGTQVSEPFPRPSPTSTSFAKVDTDDSETPDTLDEESAEDEDAEEEEEEYEVEEDGDDEDYEDDEDDEDGEEEEDEDESEWEEQMEEEEEPEDQPA